MWRRYCTKEIYLDSLPAETREQIVNVTSKHVDGAMSATKREEALAWLKSNTNAEQECQILTNARCLSEGIDVPSLDAVLFLSARNSQVDVVQSVGRVMRKAEGKKYGYIIIPVLIPSNVQPEDALNDNERFKVVWTVLNALRAHDDRFNAIVNKIELNKKRPSQIIVGRPDTGVRDDDDFANNQAKQVTQQLSLHFEQLQTTIFAKMVQKVGDRRYWEQWAKDVAQIAERYIERINHLIKQQGTHQKAFNDFLLGLQKNINPSVSQSEAVEMLSQHIITKPVFEALFDGYSFVKNNPISVSMQQMLDLLENQALDKDAEILQKFYESVKMRTKDIDNAEGKQRIIVELYDKFFKTAFPKMVEQLGIVYTPVEVVDFIIHSVGDILKKEFGRSLSDENVHILDPFTGTGTFITRLLQSGLIDKADLERKYAHEIHANEIVLLAYYIAAINIENVYHDLIGTDTYKSFEGICLTDTFQLNEEQVTQFKTKNIKEPIFDKNLSRIIAQKNAPLQIIIGNPPYSVGQKSANDNAQNQSYDVLDKRIENTYAKASNAGLNKSLYDSYIKAFRWSSDRLSPEGGIIAFVSNGAWLDGNSTDGFRKCLEKEFTNIYVFNLRGNQRTSGELSRQEGGKIFGSGSRTPIAITLLVKNPSVQTEKATIHYHDIGDYLSREEKLEKIKKLGSVEKLESVFDILQPNEHGDWLNQRNDVFGTFIPLDSDKKFDLKTQSYFVINGPGISSGRDFWVYNFSREKVLANTKATISFYNVQCENLKIARLKDEKIKAETIISSDLTKISWTVNLKNDLEKYRTHNLDLDNISSANYRPFLKQVLLFDKTLIERPGLNRMFFGKNISGNLLITLSGVGSSKDFSVYVSNKLTSYDLLEKTQCFPLYYYEEEKIQSPTLFDGAKETALTRRDGVSDYILGLARKAYGERVTKEDIFYYVYGFLHCPEYRAQFSSDLKKMLPRIPLVDTVGEFWAFSKAGRKLADLHIHYETVAPYPDVTVTGADNGHYHVEKMRFPKKDQKDTIHYNSSITISNIPAEAYDYIVNGKSAIEWIMERYQITVHKDSQIKNDPNDWADEVGNPRYILDLLLSIINVSVQTVQIVKNLPTMKF